ncbi:hypothetical protein SDC9_111484 [bioreactor metagenome]|uniref:Uncharacterized protein n=1 Tax=bioreactor metagenome TaxID=1076179 RepID=A0A645BGW0_9ZZZZ
MEDNGLGIWSFHAFNNGVVLIVVGFDIRIQNLLIGEFDIGGGKGRTIVELHAFTQMEGPGQSIRGGLPGCG